MLVLAERRRLGAPPLIVGWFFVVVILGSCTADGTEPTRALVDRSGIGSFTFVQDSGPHPDQPLDVWYFAPEGELQTSRILIVLHGRGRNAEQYRDDWVEHARREGLVLLVPEFPSELYSRQQYNVGNLVDQAGAGLPPDEWSFGVVESLYDQVRRDVGRAESGYYLYGHSAGAQFVHRFMLFMDDTDVIHAVSANSGWYTVTDESVAFPYGLGSGPTAADDDIIERMVASPLTTLLGSDDDDPDASGLRQDRESMRQGPTRLDRGFHFFRQGQRWADDHGVMLGWEIDVVGGAGHSNAEMAGAASDVLFG